MKTRLTYLTGLLSVTLLGPASAQEWSVGPKTYLGLSRRLTVGSEAVLPNGSLSTVGDGDATTSSIGVFARYDRPRWYTEANLQVGSSYAANLQVNTPLSGGPLYGRAQRTDARLMVGYKPLPWLRLSAGLVGVAYNWNVRDHTATISRLEALAQSEQNASQKQRWLDEAASYRINTAAADALKKTALEAQLSLGVDIGGLMLDLTYNPGLTPIVDGVTYRERTYALQQHYAFWTLGVGYKLFPLKKHLLAPRKNKAYARLQRDIPFIRNEFHVGVGLLAEDINSAFVYENRYTHYISPRLGWAVSLVYSRGLSGRTPTNSLSDKGFAVANTVSLLPGIRVLPLYSRHHRLGLTFGARISYRGDNLSLGSYYRTVTINGQPTSLTTIDPAGARSRSAAFGVGPQVSIDYQFLPTDRIAVGPWLRTADLGSFGLQAGYRF